MRASAYAFYLSMHILRVTTRTICTASAPALGIIGLNLTIAPSLHLSPSFRSRLMQDFHLGHIFAFFSDPTCFQGEASFFHQARKNFANLSGATLAAPSSCVTLLWFSTPKTCKDRKPNETDIFTELPTFSYSLRYSTYSRNLKRLRDVFGEGIHSFQFS